MSVCVCVCICMCMMLHAYACKICRFIALRIWYCVCACTRSSQPSILKNILTPTQNNDRINPGGQQNSREMINPDPVTAAQAFRKMSSNSKSWKRMQPFKRYSKKESCLSLPRSNGLGMDMEQQKHQSLVIIGHIGHPASFHFKILCKEKCGIFWHLGTYPNNAISTLEPQHVYHWLSSPGPVVLCWSTKFPVFTSVGAAKLRRHSSLAMFETF